MFHKFHFHMRNNLLDINHYLNEKYLNFKNNDILVTVSSILLIKKN